MKGNGIGHRRLLVASAVGALFAQVGDAVLAQDIRVEVTGSNIKRIEGEGALPVQVIDRKEIERSGVTNAMEIMNLISANNTAGNVSLGNVIGATTFSNQTASLRGLGGSSTLILVNGKRLGTFSGGITAAEGVNLASIPFAAIDHVEVLKDGASAIYGSDAIAGVINFIMRQDFSGIDATAWYGAPTRSGGGEQYQVMATAGFGDLTKDKYNAFISLNYSEQKALNQNERNFSKTATSPTSTSTRRRARLSRASFRPAASATRAFPDCAPSIVVGNRCRYDPSAIDGVNALPQTKQLNLFGSARYQINNNWQAYLTGLVLQPGNPLRHPAQSVLRPDLHHGDRHRCFGHPAAAVEPVLSHRIGDRGRRQRTTPQRALSLRGVRQPRHHRHQRSVADRDGGQGHAVELGLGLLVQLQPEHEQGALEQRLPALFHDPADPQQRPRQSVRSEHRSDHAGDPGRELQSRYVQQQAARLRD
jgi:outer membrane receptor protein involved in Fe transport